MTYLPKVSYRAEHSPEELKFFEYLLKLLSNSIRYKNVVGEISLLHPCFATMNKYEIYCIKGDLFKDIERFDTLEEAEARIKHLLKGRMKLEHSQI